MEDNGRKENIRGAVPVVPGTSNALNREATIPILGLDSDRMSASLGLSVVETFTGSLTALGIRDSVAALGVEEAELEVAGVDLLPSVEMAVPDLGVLEALTDFDWIVEYFGLLRIRSSRLASFCMISEEDPELDGAVVETAEPDIDTDS